MAAPLRRAEKRIVGEHVELLLLFTLHVGLPDRAVEAGEGAVGNLAGDGLAGQGHVEDQRVELAGAVLVTAGLDDQELRQRGTSGEHHATATW